MFNVQKPTIFIINNVLMYFVSYESIRNQQICSIKSTSNSYGLVIVSPKWKCIKFTSHTCIYPCEYEVIKLTNLHMFLSF